MFSRKNRFSFKKKLPKNIFNSQSFTLRYDKNDEGLKVGVVVSKKVDKRAVVRNKIKRKILVVVASLIKVNEPFNLVFYVKKYAVENLNIEKEIEQVIKNKINGNF